MGSVAVGEIKANHSSLSVTKREIEKFWRKKRLVEEDHFLSAIKAAARHKSTHLSAEDYLFFMDSLELEHNLSTPNIHHQYHIGIKDWWTKSKYAYLNQPAIGSTGRPSRRSNYIPNTIDFCNYDYQPCVQQLATTTPQTAHLGVF